jgi:hypothetical protein
LAFIADNNFIKSVAWPSLLTTILLKVKLGNKIVVSNEGQASLLIKLLSAMKAKLHF